MGVVVRAVGRRLFGHLEFDSGRVGLVAVRHQFITIEQLELLTVRSVALFRNSTLLDLDEVRVGRKAVVCIQRFFFLWCEAITIIIVVIVIVIVIVVNNGDVEINC